MRTGVVVGMAAENRIARRMGWPIAIGGGTARGAAAAARELVGQGCTSLISFGLAGGLDPVLRSGALVVPTTVIAGDERYATDTDLSRILGGPTRTSCWAPTQSSPISRTSVGFTNRPVRPRSILKAVQWHALPPSYTAFRSP